MHIWLHTLLHEKHVDTCLPLSDILTSSGQRLASAAMSRTAVSLCCAVVKETLNTARYLKIFNEFVDQLDDDELRNGYFPSQLTDFLHKHRTSGDLGPIAHSEVMLYSCAAQTRNTGVMTDNEFMELKKTFVC